MDFLSKLVVSLLKIILCHKLFSMITYQLFRNMIIMLKVVGETRAFYLDNKFLLMEIRKCELLKIFPRL